MKTVCVRDLRQHVEAVTMGVAIIMCIFFTNWFIKIVQAI